MSSEIKTSSALLRQVRELILAARKAAAQTVDSIQVVTFFEIGRRIVEYDQQGSKRAAYGKTILKELSARLSEEFGRGFSEDNLANMRKFYLPYGGRLEISETLSGKSGHDAKSETLSRKFPVPQKKAVIIGKLYSVLVAVCILAGSIILIEPSI